MNRIFVHSNQPTPAIVGAKGWWTWTLPDGTYFVAIGHDDIADARNQASKHPNILDVAPSRISGNAIGTNMLNAVNSFIGKRGGSSLASGATTHDLLSLIHSLTDDVAFHPEASS